ncbi:MAG: proteasome ATPase, partial [Kocuria sp.]|nr:proteasome ATPase [Kocuria sp.]
MSDATPQNRAADNTQRQINMLRDQKRNLDKQLASVGSQNQKLVRLLDASRQEIVKLKQTLAAEAVPPMSFGVVQQVNPGHQPVGNATGDGPVITVASLDVLVSGRKMRVSVSPLVSLSSCEPGIGVLLNENYVVAAVLDYDRVGEVATIKEII